MPEAANPVFDDVKPWPGENPASAGIGHNRAPLDEEARAAFRDELLRERPDFMVKLDQFEGSVDRVLVDDDDSLGRAGEFVKSLRDARQHAETSHKVAKEPYLAATRACDAEKNALVDRIDKMGREVTQRSNKYLADREAEERANRLRLEAEQRRQAQEAEAAEALRQEAADANDADAMTHVPVVAAPVQVPTSRKPEPVRSASGVTVSGRETWHSEVSDYTAAYAHVSDNPKVKEAIDRAIQGLVRAGKRELAGVRVWSTKSAVAR